MPITYLVNYFLPAVFFIIGTNWTISRFADSEIEKAKPWSFVVASYGDAHKKQEK